MSSKINIEKLIRPHLLDLEPYMSARDLYTGQNALLLDANESAYGAPIKDSAGVLSRYPDPRQKDLRNTVSARLSVSPDNLFFGVGSDEVIELLIKLFCQPGSDEVIIIEPTYGMYSTVCQINNISRKIYLLEDDFSINPAKVLSLVTDKTKLIFICSPNNPTGNFISKEHIRNICAAFNGFVILDEAYVDFASEGASMIDEIEEINNLIILRTFSKAWGMAAIRLGYCIADPVVTDWLFKIKAPYSINALTQKTALEALANNEQVKRNILLTIKQRDFLTEKLLSFKGIEKVFPSDANFILIKCANAGYLHKRLEQAGIIIRDRSSQPKLEGCLRITVGTEAQNMQLLEAMQKIMEC